MSFEIQPVQTEDDIQRTADLAGLIWREHYPPIIGVAQVEYMLRKIQSPEAIRDHIEREGYRYFLALDQGEAAGYFAVVPRPGELYLSKLYLKASRRGKGYARRILVFVESLARELNLSRIGLVTNKRNENTLKAYHALGFKVVATTVTQIGDGYVMDDFQLSKELQV